MKRLLLPIVICLSLMAGFALAQAVPGASEPPKGVPPVLWAVLGAVLPWLYETFLRKLPGWLRFVTSWGISFVIVALVGFLFLHYSVGQFLAAIGWVLVVMQAVYQLMTKPAAKAKAAQKLGGTVR